MTISESIIEWLRGYSGGIEATDRITVDQLSAQDETYGVFKAPGDVVTQYIGGAKDVTAYYLFVARQPSQTNAMRISNQGWMEGLERWIHDQNIARDLPVLEGKRHCWGISIANSYTTQEQDNDGTVYQFSVAINYSEEA